MAELHVICALRDKRSELAGMLMPPLISVGRSMGNRIGILLRGF
jgi:hypothetical protein